MQTKAEEETHFLINANNRETIHVFSDDPVWQRRLERAGAAQTKQSKNGTGKEYTIEYRQLSIRKVSKRQMTDEQKANSAQRIKKMQEARKAKNDQ